MGDEMFPKPGVRYSAVLVDPKVAPIVWAVVGKDEHCRVFWGSHGCDLKRGHEGSHWCDCCVCPEGHHDGIEAPDCFDEPGVSCVGRAPYYGPETRFYGEDAPDARR